MISGREFNLIKEMLAPPSTSPAVSKRLDRRTCGQPGGRQKTTSNYLKALRHRFWMVLAVAVPLAITTSILVLRLPAGLHGEGRDRDQPAGNRPVAFDLGRARGRPHAIRRAQANYVANREVRLRSNRARRAGRQPTRRSRRKVSQYADPAFELFKTLTSSSRSRRVNSFIVTLEGNDPALTKRAAGNPAGRSSKAGGGRKSQQA